VTDDEQETDAVLIAEIVANPADPLPCAAMADRMLERGDERLSRAYRWMARTGKRPASCPDPDKGPDKGPGIEAFAWLVGRIEDAPPEIRARRYAEARKLATLPHALFHALSGYQGSTWMMGMSFETAVSLLASRLDALRAILDGEGGSADGRDDRRWRSRMRHR